MRDHDPIGIAARTPDAAPGRLNVAFGSTPETWLSMQLAYDLAQSRHLERTIKVGRVKPVRAA